MSHIIRTTSTLLVACALTLAVSACASTSTETAPAPPAGDAGAQQSAPTTIPGAEPMHESTTKVDDVKQAVLVTDQGNVVVTFRPDKAPNTVATFVELAESGFYDGTKFHRVEPGFVAQGGDPNTKDPNADPGSYGTGGPGFRIKAEFNDLKHDRGVLAMARSQDPDSAGSQFYITLAPANFLDGNYTVFGKVVEGMDVVDKIKVGTVLKSVKIERGK